MGFFDSKSKSSTTSNNAGFSEIAGAATSLNVSAGGGKGSSTVINALDGGAVAGAFSFAGDALEKSLRQVELAGSNTASLVGNAVKSVAESARSETENVLLQGGKWVVIAVIAVAGFYALGKMKG